IMSATRYNLRRKAYRWFIHCASLCIYFSCCFLDLGSFRYVELNERLRKHSTFWQWTAVAMCIKLGLLWLEFPYVLVCIGFVYLLIFGDSSQFTENNAYYWMHLIAIVVMFSISTLQLLWLGHSSAYSSLVISIVNRVLHINRVVRRNFGDDQFYSDDSLVLLFLLKVVLTLHHILAQYRPHENNIIGVRFHTVNVILFEIFYGSYLLYQLLFLGWQRTLLTFLESYIALVQDGGSPTSDYYRKVIDVFDIYTQMSGIHFRVTNAWLKVSSMMFISVYYTAHEATYTFYCLFALSEIPLFTRAFLVIMNKVGTCLYPLVAILLMGMASDRMKHFEAQLCERIFLI
ncbi:hypothetical protein KR200_003106, partial [Drosophila serrata]